MRTIKFRAWDKKTETMNDVWAIHFKAWHDSEINYIEIYGLGTDGTEERCEEDIEIMQYTGLKDKNGTEIYEGDIINQDSKYGYKNYVMEMIQTHASDDMGVDMFGYVDVDNACEVIGNIYENPELLVDKE